MAKERRAQPALRRVPPYALVSELTALTVVLVSGCVSAPVTAQTAGVRQGGQSEAAFVDSSTLDPAIPSPSSVVGHAMGDGAVRYDPMVRYLQALADASPFVTLTPYAESHEGRKLFHLTITSEANHARLDAIKADNARLADPRTLSSPEEAERIVATLPGIAWLSYAIHGDELSSTDAAVQLAYQLAAGTDEQTRRLRDELVIHIDPAMNPDGRERYLSQLQTLTGKIPNADYQAMQHSGLWSAGRGNHYLFDLNRDWLMQVHPETRGRAAKIIEWNPHLVVDSHEMGPLDTYLFDPPREPINIHLSPGVLAWRRRFSADQAKAFDQRGWDYYTKEWYEEWYPGFTNSWTSLQGAIGLLYEQAGVDGAAVRQRAGHTLTYRDAVHHQLVSSLANLETLRAHRRAILEDFLTEHQQAVALGVNGRDVLLIPPPTDRSLFAQFATLLSRHAIEAAFSVGPFQASKVVDLWGDQADTKLLPAGTLVIRSAQPRRRLLRALLEFDPHMTDDFLHEERKDLENHRGTRVYDVTAWNLCMAYSLEAYWAEDVPDIPVRKSLTEARPAVSPDRRPSRSAAPKYGYLIDGANSDIYRAIVRLFDHKCKVRVAIEPFSIGGYDYHRGTILLRKNENPDHLSSSIKVATAGLNLDVQPAESALSDTGPDLGGRRFGLLEPPRIAIASQWPISTTSFGSIWYLLDVRMGLGVSPINLQRLQSGSAGGGVDLRKYNVIVLPGSSSSTGLGAIINEQVQGKLKSWVEAGGTLVAIGGSAAFLAHADRGLSSVRLRRDVLDKLAVYKEALEREKSAQSIDVDAERVWGTDGTATSVNGAAPVRKRLTSEEQTNAKEEGEDSGAKAAPKKELDALKREDAWLRLFSPGGVFVTAHLTPEHWLTFGRSHGSVAESKLPVLLWSSHAFMAKHPVEVPVRLGDERSLRLSGLLWPEARERWANTAFVTRERVGFGQVILFAGDPFFRGYLEGTGRLLLNALLLGPGLGASTPVPW